MTDSSKRLKIVYTLPSLMAGGAERVLMTLAGGSVNEQTDVSLISISGDGPLNHLISSDLHFVNMKRKGGVLKSLWSLRRQLKELRPDIVVSTLPHMNFAVLFLGLFFPKTKFVVRESITPSYLLDKYGIAGLLIKALYICLFPRADLVLSPSQKILDELSCFVKDRNKVFKVLHNPVDVEHYRSFDGFEKITEERKKTVRFIACGRLVKQKGFDRLIEICTQLEPSFAWHLDIYGEGPEGEALQRQIKQHGLEDRITLRGLVKTPYVFFAQADCFLLPSRYEGLPNVVLESLACGTPVIATRESGGIQEISKHTQGITVVDDMASFLKEMQKATPRPTEHFRPSLLPGQFHKDVILEEFNDFLRDLS